MVDLIHKLLNGIKHGHTESQLNEAAVYVSKHSVEGWWFVTSVLISSFL